MERGKKSILVESISPGPVKGEVFEVAWPLGPSAVKIIPLAKRLETLKDKTIGEMWDWVYRGDEIYPIVEEELKRRYPGIRFVHYDEFGNPHSANESKVYEDLPALVEKHGCDAFMVGVGC